MFDRIDSAHRFFTSLFFNDVRDQSRGPRDHENAVERGRIHSEIGQNGANRAVDINRQRFLGIGE